MAGVDHPRLNAYGLQRRIRALPINAGALHHHALGGVRAHPVGQAFTVALEAAKFASVNTNAAIGLLKQGAGADLRLMHIKPNDALVQCG